MCHQTSNAPQEVFPTNRPPESAKEDRVGGAEGSAKGGQGWHSKILQDGTLSKQQDLEINTICLSSLSLLPGLVCNAKFPYSAPSSQSISSKF